MPDIKDEPVKQQDFKPKLKPFAGGLAALQIQPVVKSEQKFSRLTQSHHNIEPITHDKYVQQPYLKLNQSYNLLSPQL
jgi:hypothetical protein